MKKTKVIKIEKTSNYLRIVFGEPTWIEEFGEDFIKLAGVGKPIKFRGEESCVGYIYADVSQFAKEYKNCERFDTILFWDNITTTNVSFELRKPRHCYRQELKCYIHEEEYNSLALDVVVYDPRTQKEIEFPINRFCLEGK